MSWFKASTDPSRLRSNRFVQVDYKAMPSHIVQEGDHLTGLAVQFGFLDFNTIWNDPANADLKNKRKDPHILLPGDVLTIPDKRDKNVSIETTKVHTFQIKTQPLKLKLVLKDFDNQPIAGVDCVLVVEGQSFKLKSDGQGMIQTAVPPTAVTGQLTIADLDVDMPVKIGHLDPYDEDPGWRARLINLGYFVPQSDDDGDAEQLGHALEEFQCDHQLPVTGNLDNATRDQLKTQHGS